MSDEGKKRGMLDKANSNVFSNDTVFFNNLIDYTNKGTIKWFRVGNNAQYISKGQGEDFKKFKGIKIDETTKGGKAYYRVHVPNKAVCIEDEVIERLIKAIKQNNLLLKRTMIYSNKMLVKKFVFISGNISKASPYNLEIKYLYFISPLNEKVYVPIFFDTIQDCYYISEVNRNICQKMINKGEFIIVKKSPCHKKTVNTDLNSVSKLMQSNTLGRGLTRPRIPWSGTTTTMM